MATYDKMTSLKNPGRSVQVESAIRDGSGKNIENNYAKQNGYYSTLKAGNADLADFADNLTPYGPNSGIEDDTPFIMQTSGGESDIGSSAQIKKLEGVSKAWNQLAKSMAPASNSLWSQSGTVLIDDYHIIVKCNNTSGSEPVDYYPFDSKTSSIDYRKHLIQGHKYLILWGGNLNGCTIICSGTKTDGTQTTSYWSTSAGTQKGIIYQHNFLSNTGFLFGIRCPVGVSVNTQLTIGLFDLTLIYGTGNEPTTVDEFKQLFPLDYYAYDAGSIVSCKVKGYKVVGYNAFDGELEGNGLDKSGNNENVMDNFRTKNYIKVIGGQKYTLEYNRTTLSGYLYYCFYDNNHQIIGTRSNAQLSGIEVECPDNACYLRLQWHKPDSNWAANPPTQEQAQVCVHLTLNESKTGYEPYWSETYEFPNVELRGVNDIKDELLPDGTLTRKIGVYTFTGSETFVDWLGSGYSLSIVISDIKGASSDSVVGNVKWSLGITKSFTDLTNNSDKYEYEIALNTEGRLYIVTTKTSSELATALTGKTIIFELSTPTTEQVDPYTENTLIDDWGTQEWLSDNVVILPQPAEFFYSVDYKAFIDSVGDREDIDYVAENIVSQEQLTEVVNGTRPVNLADVAVDIYSDREIEDAENACPPAVFSSIGGDVEIQNGNNAFEELRGNSVVFNQLVKNGNFTDTSGWTFLDGTMSASNNILTVTITNASNSAPLYRGCTIIPNHKYFATCDMKFSRETWLVRIAVGAENYIPSDIQANTWTNISGFITPTTSNNYIYIYTNSPKVLQVGDTCDFKNFMLFDLTLMFGAGNEPTTIEEFNALFPELYYDYNAGTLLSSKSTGLVIKGMNQFDGELEIGSYTATGQAQPNKAFRSANAKPIKVIAGQTYILDVANAGLNTISAYILYEYDENGNFIQRDPVYNNKHQFTLTNNTRYIKFACFTGDDEPSITGVKICFRLYHDTPNVPYEEYEEETVTLPNIELRSAGSVYDVAYSTGGGKRRIGVLDLGSLSSYQLATNNVVQIVTSGIGIKANSDYSYKCNLRCSKYITSTYNETYAATVKNSIAFINDSIGIQDDTFENKTSTEIKEILSGVYLFYELDTETDITVEENPGWPQYIKTNNYGTFEFISEEEIQVPQAYFVRYTANLVEFLDSTYERAGGSANNVALVNDVTAVDEKYDVISEQLKEALGGTLRNCLAIKESLDFNNTAWVDISTLTWVKQTKYTAYAYGLEDLIQVPSAYNVLVKALCSKYKVVTENDVSNSDKVFGVSTTGALLINDISLNSLDEAGIKKALINVLVAYEKAE